MCRHFQSPALTAAPSTATIILPTEDALIELGRALGRSQPANRQFLLHLHGPLGAGKTTLVRGLLRALGHEGAVRSPTFGLLERYALSDGDFLHADLYRLRHPQEWIDAGLADAFALPVRGAIEWPERSLHTGADLVITLDYADVGRRITIQTGSHVGRQWLNHLMP